MIQFHSKNNPPTPESLIGRIVLRDAHLLWVAVGHPRRVVSHRGSKLILESIPIGFCPTARDGKSGFSTDSPFARSSGGENETLMLTAVRATCDTLSEAIYLLHMSDNAGDEFIAMKARAKEVLATSHGLEIEDPQMQVTPKP